MSHMSQINFITRADDLGSSISANKGIEIVCNAGFFKNVSVMAPGPHIKHAADLLAGRKDICFGMHMTLNAEWDKIKWKPLTDIGIDSGLVDENGYFLNSPQLFKETKPSIENIMNEVEAQYNQLTELGFDLKYIDSHMMYEYGVPGADDAVKKFAVDKGLIDHMYFYSYPEGFIEACKNPEDLPGFLKTLSAGQYITVIHPAVYGEDLLQTGAGDITGEQIAKERSTEAALFSDPALLDLLDKYGYAGIRYDEAKPFDRLII